MSAPRVANGDRDRIETGSVVVDGVAVFFRRIPGEGPPVVLAHGVPNHSEQWLPFLGRMRGPALAFDMPGFGRSARPDPDSFDACLIQLATNSSSSAFCVCRQSVRPAARAL